MHIASVAFAIFFTLVPFTVAFTNGKVVFFMWEDALMVAAWSQVSGIRLWMSYYLTNRRLRRTSF